MNSYFASFTNLDPDDSISITAGASSTSVVGDSLLVRGNKDLSLLAGTTGTFTARQEYRVETTNDITVLMRGFINVVTSSTEIIATQENAGDIDIDATTITYTLSPEAATPALFRTEENLLIQAAASSTFTSSTGSTEFRTSGRAPLSVNAGNAITITGVPTATFQLVMSLCLVPCSGMPRTSTWTLLVPSCCLVMPTRCRPSRMCDSMRTSSL